MEINRFDDVRGVIPTADVVEGRFVLLTPHSFDVDFGSQVDLPGAKVPATAEEARRAKFIITFAVDNRDTPIYRTIPSFSFAVRGGWDQAANAPFSATVYLTHPGNQESLTIPSGQASLAYTEGTFTLPSGAYIYDANLLEAGAPFIVANTAEDTTDAGKVKYQATMDERVMGFVDHYDSATGRLTVRIE